MLRVSGRKSCVSAGKTSVSKCNLTPALSCLLCTRSSAHSWSPADTDTPASSSGENTGDQTRILLDSPLPERPLYFLCPPCRYLWWTYPRRCWKRCTILFLVHKILSLTMFIIHSSFCVYFCVYFCCIFKSLSMSDVWQPKPSSKTEFFWRLCS